MKKRELTKSGEVCDSGHEEALECKFASASSDFMF